MSERQHVSRMGRMGAWCVRAVTGLVVLIAPLALFAPAALGAAPAVISISSISGSFFPNTGDTGQFNATPSTPVAFTADFPVLNFNPPVGAIPCSNATHVDINTRPMTNVVPQPDGSCKTVVVQGNKQQAGAGDLANFNAVFTGSFLVSAPGRVTFNVFSDDGWILSIGPGPGGAQPSYTSGPNLNGPKTGPFTGYQIVGSYNLVSAATQNNLVVNFPTAGTFPFEIDYSECCDGSLAFTLTANNLPIPPSAPLSIDVQGLAAGGQVQGQQHLEAIVASGQAQQIELLVDGRPIASTKTAPFTFDWDTTQETPGSHKVLLRGTDAAGGTTEKEVTLDVLATPKLGPAPVTNAPTGAPQEDTSGPLLIIATVLVAVLVGVAFWFTFRGMHEAPAPVPAAPLATAAPAVAENTEFIGRESLRDLTMVSVRRPQLLPKARLLVKPDREIPLSRSTATIIGRDTSLPAAVEDRQVSRHHARIICEGDEFWIEDLNSTNGTRVNGVAIERQQLANNDQIGLGDTIVTFSLEAS